MKNFLTVFLVALALVAAYMVLSNPSKPVNHVPPGAINVSSNTSASEPVNPDVFAAQLLSAKDVFIVQDLRDTSNDAVRRSIQQCGVDFAGSRGLVGKNLTIFAFEKNECTSIDGIVDLNICLEKLKTAEITIHIKEGNQSTFYKNKLVVGVINDYSPKSCNINFVPTQPEPQITQMNITDEQLRTITEELKKINTPPDNAKINSSDYPKLLGRYYKNGLVLKEQYFCSDLCPAYAHVEIVFENVASEDCNGIGGEILTDPAWGAYLGCTPKINNESTVQPSN